MALVGVSITKRTAFRDSVQEFSNVYHYTYTGLNPSASLAESIIDAIVTIERPVHSGDVTFVRAKCWSAGGTIAQNTMIFQKLLTGVGSGPSTAMDKERAFLIQWAAGTDSRGKPVRLKKWFHLIGPGSTQVSLTAGVLDNTLSFSASSRTTTAGLFNGLRMLSVNGTPMQLCAASGRLADGDAVAHKFLEHHQLGDQWR
jgi:hypothetical protein